MSLSGPNKISKVSLEEYRAKRRVQELVFDIAAGLTKHYVGQPKCQAPAQVLFPQLMRIVERYLKEHVNVRRPAASWLPFAACFDWRTSARKSIAFPRFGC